MATQQQVFTSQPFRFFDLPQELRDRIHDYLVIDIELPDTVIDPDGHTHRTQCIINNARILAVALASRRLSSEYRRQVPPPDQCSMKTRVWSMGNDIGHMPDGVQVPRLHVDCYIFCPACIEHDGFGSSPSCDAHAKAYQAADLVQVVSRRAPQFKSISVRIGFLTWCIDATTWSEFKEKYEFTADLLELLHFNIPNLTSVELIKYSGMEDWDTIFSGDSWRYTLATWTASEGWKASPARQLRDEVM